MIQNILFSNIRIVNPLQHFDSSPMYVFIRDGVIQYCGPNQPATGADTTVFNGEHLLLLPGLFDMHVHLREPGQEYKETIKTGTDSAANGGFTGVCCMPNTIPAIDSAPTVEYIQNRAKITLTEVYCCAAITKNREGQELAPMIELQECGAVMFSDDGACVRSADMMRRAFEYIAPFDGLLSQHCEEHSLTEGFAMNEGSVSTVLGLKGYPSVAEDIIVARDIKLAEYCGNRRYHVSHLSAKGSVELVRSAKQRGQRVTCEVTPHHFCLTDEAVRSYDTNAKMNPPLRTQADINAILDGLQDGTIDSIATDHAPHATHEKEVEFPLAANGIIGLETSLGLCMTYLVHTGILSMHKLVELMSLNPRKILGLPPIYIREGEPANCTIIHPDYEWNVDVSKMRSHSMNTPFNGFPLKGKPVYTINRGQIWECDL